MSESIAAVLNLLTAPFPVLLLGLFAAAIYVGSRVDPEPHQHHFRKHMTGLWVCECGAARDHRGQEVSRG